MRVALVSALACALIVGFTGTGSAATGVRGQPGKVTRTTMLRWPELGGHRSFLRRFTAPLGYLKTVRVLIYGIRVPTGRFVATVACKAEGRSPALAQQAWVWSGYSLHLLVHLRTNNCSEVAGRFVRMKVVVTSVGT